MEMRHQIPKTTEACPGTIWYMLTKHMGPIKAMIA